MLLTSLEPTFVTTIPDLAEEIPGVLQVPTEAGVFRLTKFEMTDGLSRGVQILVVDSGKVRAAICPTRGMNLWKANIDGLPCQWHSPVCGPVHPIFVPIDEPSGIGWLSGFDELLARCGLQSFGAPDFDENHQMRFPLHGRVSNLPASNLRMEVDTDRSLLHILGDVHETRFLQADLRLTACFSFAFGENKIGIRDTVRNHSSRPAKMQMLYHVNIGSPILQAESTLKLAATEIVARNSLSAQSIDSWHLYEPPRAGFVEQVYFSRSSPAENGWCTAMLSSGDQQNAFALHYHSENLPYFSQWKNTAAESDGYVTGLEPATGFPNSRGFEQAHGRVVDLAPGQSREFHLQLEATQSGDRVAEIASSIAAIQSQNPDLVSFRPDWCVPEA